MKSKTKKVAVKKIAKKAAAKKIVKKAAKKVAPKKSIKRVAKKAISKNAASKKSGKKPSPKPVAVKVVSSKHIIAEADGQQMLDTFMYFKNAKKINEITFFSGREFDISLFQAILKLDGVKKIRFRNAVNDKNEHTLIVTGADANGYDILIPHVANNTNTQAKQLPLTDGDNPPPPPTNGMGDMGDQCSDPKYK